MVPPSVTCGRPRGHWHFSRACHATPPSEKRKARRVLQACFRLAKGKANQAGLPNHWWFCEVRGQETAERLVGLASEWLVLPSVTTVYASVIATSPPAHCSAFILFRPYGLVVGISCSSLSTNYWAYRGKWGRVLPLHTHSYLLLADTFVFHLSMGRRGYVWR